jgi:hypothetical protein
MKTVGKLNVSWKYFMLAPLVLLLVCVSGGTASATMLSTKANLTDTTKKETYGNPYNKTYAPHPGYTAEGHKNIAEKNDARNAAIVANMIKDGFITDAKNLSFKISNDAFVINGIKQSAEVFERYKQNHVPKTMQTGEWSWSYNVNQSAK